MFKGKPSIRKYKLSYRTSLLVRQLNKENYSFAMVSDSPVGLFAIMVKQGTTETMYYVHKDYLGSITSITDASGNLLESLSYDPCSVKLGFCECSETKALVERIPTEARSREGRRRKATDWTDYNVTSTLFDRGFTGHSLSREERNGKHLPHFGLINMNGRVYDPFLARFLSPDPFVQAPNYTQNFNRYSYAWNNPLKYTDPDGEWVHLALGAMIGGYINLVANAKKVQKPWQAFAYFGVGALAGGLSAGIGAGVGAALAGNAAAGGGFAAGFMGTAAISSSGFVAGAISGAAAGFTNGLVSGTGNQLIEGKKFGDAFVNGGLDQAWRQGIGDAAVGGVMGSIDAILNKEDWLTGSTKKGYAFTDGDNVFSESGLLNDKGIKLNDSYAPQKVEIKAPGGRYTKYDIPSAEGGYTLLNKGNIAHEFYFEITDNNSIIFEFFNGSPGGGLLAAKVSYPIRVQSNNIFKHQLFFGTHRRYSGFLMFLNY